MWVQVAEWRELAAGMHKWQRVNLAMQGSKQWQTGGCASRSRSRRRDFHVEAVWAEDAGVFRSESNIAGLFIEAETIAEFREVLSDVAPELIMANHVSRDDLLAKPLKELIPTIWSSTNGDLLRQASD